MIDEAKADPKNRDSKSTVDERKTNAEVAVARKLPMQLRVRRETLERANEKAAQSADASAPEKNVGGWRAATLCVAEPA